MLPARDGGNRIKKCRSLPGLFSESFPLEGGGGGVDIVLIPGLACQPGIRIST